MKPDVKKKWVRALESGDYPKTKSQLADGEGYCCLGVLCDLAVKEGVIDGFDGDAAYLPSTVAEWAGVPDFGDEIETGSLTSEQKIQSTLAVENDESDDFSVVIETIKKRL